MLKHSDMWHIPVDMSTEFCHNTMEVVLLSFLYYSSRELSLIFQEAIKVHKERIVQSGKPEPFPGFRQLLHIIKRIFLSWAFCLHCIQIRLLLPDASPSCLSNFLHFYAGVTPN